MYLYILSSSIIPKVRRLEYRMDQWNRKKAGVYCSVLLFINGPNHWPFWPIIWFLFAFLALES